MDQWTIVQVRNGEPDTSSSAATYAELVHQQGLPATHTQLLQELKTWAETHPVLRCQPEAALQYVLDIEGKILMDAGVAGVAAEHIPFLYTIFGEVFEELGPRFRRDLQRAAALAEQAYEEAIQTQLEERGIDRLEAVYIMETLALQRLQERQERVMLLVEGLGEDDVTALSQ